MSKRANETTDEWLERNRRDKQRQRFESYSAKERTTAAHNQSQRNIGAGIGWAIWIGLFLIVGGTIWSMMFG